MEPWGAPGRAVPQGDSTDSMRSKRPQAEEPQAKSGSQRPDEMSAEVLEFVQAIDDYKRKHHRPFPSWSEVLEVVKALGYVRPARP